MSHLPDETFEDTLLPPSPSFMIQSFDSPIIQRPPPSHPSSHNAVAWPVSYQVHTLERRGRPTRPSRLNVIAVDSDPNATAALPAAAPSTSTSNPAKEISNPFSSAPSTPGASVHSLTSSSSSSLPAILPPAPASPPPNPTSPRFAVHSHATAIPTITPIDPPAPTQTLPSPTSAVPPTTVHHRRTRSRTARDRERYHSHVASALQVTPPATAVGERDVGERDGDVGGGAGVADRTSIRDTFSPPPVLFTLPAATGTSTPSTRPPSSKHSGSGVGIWRTQAGLSGDAMGLGEKTYSLDFTGVTDSLKAMHHISGGHVQDDGFASESFSSISIPYGYGAAVTGGRPGKVSGDGDSVMLRPSKLLQGEVKKPWLEERDWRVRASWWITVLTALLGIGASFAVCWFGYWSVPMITSPLCLVMEDNFDTFNTSTWHHEVDMSGFGNGEFEMATLSSNNSYVKDGMLYIVPTLTSDVIGIANVFDGYTYNITGCTNVNNTNGLACGAVSNATAGTIINPVMSARITTQKSFSIGYGKVEIRARMPKGDWLWPGLWMLPVDNKYGPWPRSGEIDIVESRGNSPSYAYQGINYIRSSLNWGPTAQLNRAFKTFALWFDRRGSFGNEFHTFTMEWTPDFLRVYIDTRIKRTLDVRFNTPFFARGNFPDTVVNNSQIVPLEDPWAGRGNSAPFDQQFFLIMNVAVGSTDGWFPDNVGGKPWVDGSRSAMRDFAEAQDQWYPTWPADPAERGMVVDYVKMWELC